MTVVQYRDKTSDTGLLIQTAKALHEKCQQHHVPLIINDRVDVALAVGCEGVHLGQDDTNIRDARQLLGDGKIIGATVSSVEEARIAVERGADYLGIGTLYATATKTNTKDIIGINGIRKILHSLNSAGEASRKIKTVCIGGVNASNVQRVVHQLYAPSGQTLPKPINGVAVVSAIIGAPDAKKASSDLKQLLSTLPPFKAKCTPQSETPPQTSLAAGLGTSSEAPPSWPDTEALQRSTLQAVAAVHSKSPLSHNMTNLVVQNFAASVALAIGASPIMSNNGDEAPDLARLGGGLVINMGTATPDALTNHRKAIAAYNTAGGPIVLDPVGAGATTARKEALAFLLASGYFDLIKGNEREIAAVARASGLVLDDGGAQQRGVDSGDALFSLPQKAALVARVAARERNVVLMTGATDVISDGRRTFSVSNGHRYLGMVTGSGCTLGTTLSAYMAAAPEDKLLAALAGILHFEIAAERAAEKDSVYGPGTFVPAFIDELYQLRIEAVEGSGEWTSGIKVEALKEIEDTGLLKE